MVFECCQGTQAGRLLKKPSREDTDSLNTCLCDVIVQVGHLKCYDGPLTPWTHEEEFCGNHVAGLLGQQQGCRF